MKNRNSYRYFQNELLSMVELPYGNGNFVMNVFLPREDKVVGDILEQLTPSNWESWLKGLNETEETFVQLPKFKYEYKSLLNDPLCLMGLEEAFDGRADFSGINPYADLYISRVIHQTFIDVNEKGTEAAAVTIVEIKETSTGPGIPYFIANRPFIYAIRETITGALLFMGKVGKPEYN
jgi:serpin B